MLSLIITFNVELYIIIILLSALLAVNFSYAKKDSLEVESFQVRELTANLCYIFGWACFLAFFLYLPNEINFALTNVENSANYYNNKDFTSSTLLVFCKVLVLILSASCLLLSAYSISISNIRRPEYPFFFLIALLAMLMLISANNLLYAYLALELLNFALYLMLSMKTASALANEATQRYFVYSSYASALFLLGITIIYGILGTLNISELHNLFIFSTALQSHKILISFAMLLILITLFFKLAIFPFHFWVAEVYAGTSYATAVFLATAPKVALITLFLKIYLLLCEPFLAFFSTGIKLLSLVTIVYGVLAGLYEYNLKRFLAYSTLINMGFIMLALSYASLLGFQAALSYLTLYLLMTLAFFGLLLQYNVKLNTFKVNMDLESMELKQIFSLHYFTGHLFYRLAFALILLSLAGIPPLAGFFIKLWVLQSCVQAQDYLVAFLVFLLSTIGSILYLRILRILFAYPLVLSFSKKSWGVLFFSATGLYVMPLVILVFLLLIILGFSYFLQSSSLSFFAYLASTIILTLK